MINEVLKKVGSWSIKLNGQIPSALLDDIEYFSHVAVVPGELDPLEYGDQLLTHARYVGIVRLKTDASVGGIGLEGWLGDEDKKGEVYETARVFQNETFANTVRSLLPSAIGEGTIHSVPGNYNHVHRYEDPRTAIDYVCDSFNADWRVRNDFKLDAGLSSDLYVTEPTCIIVRKGAGTDLHLRALPGKIDAATDAKDLTTRVLLLAEGDGASIATGSADIIANPYKDFYGNPLVRTRMVSESETSTGSASSRAQLQLNRFTRPKRTVSLSAKEFDVSGDFSTGDYVWVYDPETGLYDLDNEVSFQGQILNPVAIRVLGVSYPIERGFTVAHRSQDGVWTDITRYVEFETGETTIDVGDNFSTSLVSDAEAIRPRLASDLTPPAVPGITSITTGSYLSGTGQTRARLNINWAEPLNVDGSTITDGAFYTVRYRVHGQDAYSYMSIDWSTTGLMIGELSNGETYDVSVEAVDTSNNHSGYGADQIVLASQDAIPPSTPAAPDVAGNTLAIQVTHNLGKATGGTFNLESDIAALVVYVGNDSGFTPSGGNRVGQIDVTYANLDLQVPAIGSFQVADGSTKWVKVIAVDSSGNPSQSSAAAQAQALLIDTIHITDAAITNAKVSDLSVSKLTSGTITADGINLAANGYIRSIGHQTGVSGWVINGNGNAEFNQVTVRGTVYASDGVFSGSLNAATGTFAGQLSAATGTFKGALSAASGSFSGDISGSSLSVIYMQGGATVQGSFYANGEVRANSFITDASVTADSLATELITLRTFGGAPGDELQIVHDALPDTFVFQVTGGGDAWINAYGFRHLGGGYQVGSDRALKKSIKDATGSFDGLEAIRQLEFRQFEWKSSGVEDFGFIADEMPDFIVSKNNDGRATGWMVERMAIALADAVQKLDQRVSALEV